MSWAEVYCNQLTNSIKIIEVWLIIPDYKIFSCKIKLPTIYIAYFFYILSYSNSIRISNHNLFQFSGIFYLLWIRKGLRSSFQFNRKYSQHSLQGIPTQALILTSCPNQECLIMSQLHLQSITLKHLISNSHQKLRLTVRFTQTPTIIPIIQIIWKLTSKKFSKNHLNKCRH